MFKKTAGILVVVAGLALSVAGCAPTAGTGLTLPQGSAEVTADAALQMGEGAMEEGTGALATVDQAAPEAGDPAAGNSAAGLQMGQGMETPMGMEVPSQDAPQEPSGVTGVEPSGIVHPDASTGGIVNVPEGAVVDGQPGSTEGGPGAEGGEAGGGEEGFVGEAQLRPETWPVFSSQPYLFQIAYPQAHVIRQPQVQANPEFGPAPLAIFEFVDPAFAQGELAALQPPDLSIRVYDNSGRAPLENWLITNGKVAPNAGLVGERYEARTGIGVRVCQSVAIAPGCSVYFANEGYVYELTPLGLAGEAMLSSFAFSG